MLDRFGAPIRCDWSAHQIEWLKAAMTLPAVQMREAMEDIADLTGRSYAAVWAMKGRLEEKNRLEQRRARLAEKSQAWLAEAAE